MKETSERGQYEFHYNREERLSMSPDLENAGQRKGWLRGNRSLIILFIDIFVIVILFTVIYPFITNNAGAVRMDGYSAALKAFRYDNTIFVSLKVVEVQKEHAAVPGTAFRARFESGERFQLGEGFLPSGDNETILRGTMPDYRGSSEVKATVEMRGEKREITVRIKDADR